MVNEIETHGEVQIIPIAAIAVENPRERSEKSFRALVDSIGKVGLKKPITVARDDAGSGDTYSLVCGQGRMEAYVALGETHVRLHVLKELTADVVTCLVATNDESFTYNKRISRLATIQEHKMILRAIERGVPEARIAAALNVDVALIRRKRTLLNGICPESAELLKAKHCPVNSFRSLHKMKPLRQIQAAELMIAANNYTVAYTEAILAATDAADLVDPASKKEPVGVTREQAERMKAEMASLQKNIKLIEGTLGPDHLRLVVAGRYVERLLMNDRLVRYLEKNHGEILGELKKIVADLSRPGPSSEGSGEAEE